VDPATSSVTSVTLLVRLRQTPADQAAWAGFLERYVQRLHAWQDLVRGGRRGRRGNAASGDDPVPMLMALVEFRKRLKDNRRPSPGSRTVHWPGPIAKPKSAAAWLRGSGRASARGT
jgi:hypothetical protein